MEISAKMVKDLREKTGLGMMDCKKALVESAGRLGQGSRISPQKGGTESGHERRPCNLGGADRIVHSYEWENRRARRIEL